jgi:hypothetical protein
MKVYQELDDDDDDEDRLFHSFLKSHSGERGGVVHTGSTRHCGHYWPIEPAPGDCEDGEVGGMNGFGMGNSSTRRKSAPAPLCPPQIQLDQTRARTRTAALGSLRLTA